MFGWLVLRKKTRLFSVGELAEYGFWSTRVNMVYFLSVWFGVWVTFRALVLRQSRAAHQTSRARNIPACWAKPIFSYILVLKMFSTLLSVPLIYYFFIYSFLFCQIKILKEEVAFHQSVYEQQVDYSESLLDAVRWIYVKLNFGKSLAVIVLCRLIFYRTYFCNVLKGMFHGSIIMFQTDVNTADCDLCFIYMTVYTVDCSTLTALSTISLCA